MTFDTELASTLQKLLGLQPALIDDLGNANSLDHAVQQIVAAGERHGIQLEATALISFLQTANQHSTATELSDNQLQGVDGGGGFMRISDVHTSKALCMLGPVEFRRRFTEALNHINRLHEENRP